MGLEECLKTLGYRHNNSMKLQRTETEAEIKWRRLTMTFCGTHSVPNKHRTYVNVVHSHVCKNNTSLKNAATTCDMIGFYKCWVRGMCFYDWPAGAMLIRPLIPAQVAGSMVRGSDRMAPYSASKLKHKTFK